MSFALSLKEIFSRTNLFRLGRKESPSNSQAPDAPFSAAADYPLKFSPAGFSQGENCYAYALGLEGRPIDPGYIAVREGKEYTHFSGLFLEEMTRLSEREFNKYLSKFTDHWRVQAEADGLIPVKDALNVPPQFQLVALAVKSHTTSAQTGEQTRDPDYHWFRRDETGAWSHKTPKTQQSNLDFAGHPIADLQNADKGDYKTVVGYFLVPKNIASLQKRAVNSAPHKSKARQASPADII